MPIQDNRKAGKHIVSSAVAGILAVSMTPAIALAEEPIEQNAEPAAAAQNLEGEQPAVTDIAEEDTTEEPETEAGSDEVLNEAVETIEGEEAPAIEEAAESKVVDEAEETTIDEAAGASDDTEETEKPAETVKATKNRIGAQAAVILQTAGTKEFELNKTGVTVCQESVKDTTFNVTAGQALLIEGINHDGLLVFENCIFNLSGQTELFQSVAGASGSTYYYNGETRAKLCVGGNVVFRNCKFIGKDVMSLFVYDEETKKMEVKRTRCLHQPA